ncbi:MAG: cytochrome c oxidase assembly protein [Hyphomicrobiaceae bacterium]
MSKQKITVAICLGMLSVMAGITAYSPTLYTLFCKVTGYGGTTQRANVAPDHVVDRLITVRFDGNVSRGLPWKFEPVQEKMDVKLGKSSLAIFRATNLSDHTITGTAGFNIAPEQMGPYFSKIQCFCFTRQTLKPGQTAEMPVTFFVDPKMLDDPDTRHLTDITLSYVFYPVKDETTSSKSKTDKTATAPKDNGSSIQ